MNSIIYPSSKIYTSQSQVEGLGVFAREDILEGEIIEDCPIIKLSEDQLPDLIKTKLLEYYFAWDVGFKNGAICLGYGSLYNHSYEPNAKYLKLMEEDVIRFVAIKKIKRDEEILVNYNMKPDDKTKLWFEARKTFS